MTAPVDPVAAFLDALDALPPTAAVSYRGRPSRAALPDGLVVTEGLLATSRDPAVAREGGTVLELFVVVGRTGRDLSPLSAHPEEQEVLFRPGTPLSPITSLVLPVSGTTVHVLEELVLDEEAAADGAALPPDLPGLVALVDAQVAASQGVGPVGVVGKYAGPVH